MFEPEEYISPSINTLEHYITNICDIVTINED